jgi:hypothetical protein
MKGRKRAMKFYRKMLTVFGLAVLFGLTAAAQIPQVHRHAGRLESLVKEISKDFSITEAPLPKDVAIENVVRNRARTFEAFIADSTRIFYKNLKTGKVFEIKGLPFEWRFFSDLTWTNNETLMFDRWVEPHYATHYAVNVVSQKLLDAAPFPDEFMLKQIRKERKAPR